MLVADADLMDDRLWTAPVAGGERRHARLADNPLVVADWLDALAGIRRARSAGAVQWLPEAPNRALALLLGLAPALLVAGSGLASLRRRR